MKSIIYTILFIIFTVFSSSVVQATDSVTDTIKVDVTQSTGKTIARYTVVQAFKVDTKHGIFLALPKTSGGVKIDYNLLSVTKQDRSEPYQKINDILNYRFRIGDPNVQLKAGVYVYNIIIEGSYDSNNQFNYPILTDWNDTISNLEVSVNGNILPSNGSKALYSIVTNTGKPELSLIIQLYNQFKLPIVMIIIGLIIAFIAYYSIKINHSSSEYPYTFTEFQPPANLLPWQGAYLINDGTVDLKKTLIAYYLYLHNLGYISLGGNSNSKKINFIINQELPNVLPTLFNDIINQSQNNSLDKVFKDLKISDSYSQNLNKHITQEVKIYYDKLPYHDAFGTTFMIYVVVYIIVICGWFSLIESRFLLTPIWLWLILGIGLFFIPWLYKFLSTHERFNNNGLQMFHSTKGFYNYINTAEKDKLDFDNNPSEGTKYYLDNVPWAAQFGLLKQFNTLASNLNIPQSNIDSANIISTSVLASSLYVAPSSSGNFGGGGGFSGGGGSW